MRKALQAAFVAFLVVSGHAVGGTDPDMTMPQGSKLVFDEDWSTGRIEPCQVVCSG